MKKIPYILLMLPLLSPGSAASAADCWELTDKNGQTILANDIWHLKSRLGGGGILIGELDGKDASIAVADINTIVLAPVKSGVLSLVSGGTMQGDIAFIDGTSGKFVSDASLMFLKDAQKDSIPLADLRSISRCSTKAAGTLAASEQATADTGTPGSPAIASDVDSVYLDNGDILTGAITIDDIQWQSPYAALSFKRDQVRAITLHREGMDDGLIELRSGDRISGTLGNTSIEMTLKFGQRVPLAADKIRAIHFMGQGGQRQ
ncbi:MAG TPA: hypothetical protein VLB10_03900 [Gammaproteobacteria bacterium]|jgi:hypothetical protein|nr:hypothetical protein [Gammaproteobacteria bacterium]